MSKQYPRNPDEIARLLKEDTNSIVLSRCELDQQSNPHYPKFVVSGTYQGVQFSGIVMMEIGGRSADVQLTPELGLDGEADLYQAIYTTEAYRQAITR